MLDTLLASFATAFSQANRLLELHFSDGSGPAADTLLPHVLTGSGQLSSCYRYTLQCLSSDVSLELKTLLGLGVEVGILSADGGRQVITGLVTSAEFAGSDGGFSRYDLTIEPPLALLRQRTTSRVFQDVSVPDIVKQILDEHLAGNPAIAASFAAEFDLSKTYPQRSYCAQYRESDLDFIQRLLAEEGIAYRFRFTAGDAPVTTFVAFDDPYQLDAAEQARIRFHRAAATEADDTLTQWGAVRQITPGQVQLASFDYKPVDALKAEDGTAVDHGDGGRQAQSTLIHYDAPGGYFGQDSDDLSRYAQLRQQAFDRAAKTFSGEGTVRSLNIGEWFQLDQHPAHDDDAPENRQFTVTGHTLTAYNNLPGDLQQGVRGLLAKNDAPAQPFKVRVDAVRRGIPLNPAFADTAHSKPTAPGLQTATVVGPRGASADSNQAEEIHTDAMGRIKIQLHWQRPDEHPQSGANRDDNSSCWVRVAYPSAGDGWGTQHIPRVGQEVVVQFVEGDIDRPLVTGVLFNGAHRTPTFSGAGSLPANKTLSGIKSQEYKGSQYNELLFDDSTGEVRTKLSSEHGKTQLNQGYLTHPRSDGKAEARGEGFELRTDQHGAVRAGHGLLISADARNGASGKQLDRAEAQSQLDAAFALAQTLSDTATHQQADTSETGKDNLTVQSDNSAGPKHTTGHQQHLKEALKSWDKGSNTDKDGKSGSQDQAGQQPILVLSAPAGIAATTPQSQTITAGTNLDWVAQRDTNQTSGRRWLHNVGEHISLFVAGVKDKVSLKLIAAKGKVQLQAQEDSVEIAAAKDITITAHDNVHVVAAKEILLVCAGAYIRIAGGNIDIHAPGKVDFKGASHSLGGPASTQEPKPDFPKAKMCEFSARDAAATGDALAPMK
ncbi:type VI secretion system Vgr family protein [Andreprevotia chitinilytica]|uniref:type VI secretion system Vgr family protein n=1 Tax=Andreprevotia chitinilytica TaxID=396808 RepID=UPI00054CF954|nr:type VI secretion system Vgr family protein [Andreprevotia chitinilytica]